MPPDNPKIPDPHDGDQDHRELNGYPGFTKSNVVVLCGFASIETLEGYNLNSVQGVMLSSVGGISLFDPPLGQNGVAYGPTVPSLLNYATPGTGGEITSTLYHRNGETIDPALTGWTLSESFETEHKVGTYRLIDENHISISFPKVDRMCYLDVVIINAANYGTTTVTVSTDTHPNQLYVRYYA